MMHFRQLHIKFHGIATQQSVAQNAGAFKCIVEFWLNVFSMSRLLIDEGMFYVSYFPDIHIVLDLSIKWNELQT